MTQLKCTFATADALSHSFDLLRSIDKLILSLSFISHLILSFFPSSFSFIFYTSVALSHSFDLLRSIHKLILSSPFISHLILSFFPSSFLFSFILVIPSDIHMTLSDQLIFRFLYFSHLLCLLHFAIDTLSNSLELLRFINSLRPI